MATNKTIKLLSGVGVTGTGDAFDLNRILKNHVMQITFTNSGGSVTALTVTLEGSLDGISWSTIGTKEFVSGELTAKLAMHNIVNYLSRFVRANVTVLTDTGTSAVSVIYGGIADDN